MPRKCLTWPNQALSEWRLIAREAAGEALWELKHTVNLEGGFHLARMRAGGSPTVLLGRASCGELGPISSTWG